MRLALILGIALSVAGCGDDGTEADRLGVGAQCAGTPDCDPEDDIDLVCLPDFSGGYCGLADCIDDTDCPDVSACIAHGDGSNYCFRICADKAECNVNRDVDNESNCSSNVDFTDGAQGRKACVPPSG